MFFAKYKIIMSEKKMTVKRFVEKLEKLRNSNKFPSNTGFCFELIGVSVKNPFLRPMFSKFYSDEQMKGKNSFLSSNETKHNIADMSFKIFEQDLDTTQEVQLKIEISNHNRVKISLSFKEGQSSKDEDPILESYLQELYPGFKTKNELSYQEFLDLIDSYLCEEGS